MWNEATWNLKACDWQQARHRRIERGLQFSAATVMASSVSVLL